MRQGIFQFVFQWRYSAHVTALGFLGAMTLLALLAGSYRSEAMPYYFGSEREYYGAVLLILLMPSYMATSAVMSLRRTAELAGELDAKYATGLLEKIHTVPKLPLLLAAFAGFLYAVIFNIPGNGLNFFSTQPGEKMTIFGQILVWTLIAIFLYLRVYTSIQFRRAGTKVPIDIFETSHLKPFAQVGLIDVLVLAAGMVLSTVQSLDFSFRIDNYYKALIIVIPAVVFTTINPMWQVHQRMKKLKDEELRQLNNIIAETPKDLETDKMQSLEVLLQRRERVASLATWPIDLSVLQRFVFYIIIPPMAWVGGAIVEYFVESAIGQ